MFTRKSISLIAVLAALCVLGALATSASATRIKPANQAITATNVGTTKFIPENAYANASVQCETSTATATTPTEVAPPGGTNNNINRTAIGARSEGPGGVTTDAVPSFTNCAIYTWNGVAWVKSATPATVAVNPTWTFNGDFISSTAIPVAIGVPSNGAVISIPNATSPVCTITVSPGRGSAVMGRWTNGANSEANPSTMRIDSQLRYTEAGAGCLGNNTANPAQFEGTYNVKTTPPSATPVIFEG